MTDTVVTKISAAERQLQCAVELFFADGDAVAVHTLVCASHGIIRDICRAQGKGELLTDFLENKGDRGEQIRAALRRPANYFKHADKDSCPNCGTWFNEDLSEVFMHAALRGLCELGRSMSVTLAAYVVYMRNYGNLLPASAWDEFTFCNSGTVGLGTDLPQCRSCFLAAFTEALEKS